MAQSANDSSSELPSGYRSKIACALHADDTYALVMALRACSQTGFGTSMSFLLTDHGGKVPSENDYRPWSGNETKQSQLKCIDNDLYECFNRWIYDGCLHISVLYVAVKLGSVRNVRLLMSDKYRKDLDPAYDENRIIRAAGENGNVEVLDLLLNDSRIDPYEHGRYGLSAVDQICKNGHVDAVKLLISSTRVDTRRVISALHHAFKNQHGEVVKLVMSVVVRAEHIDMLNEELQRTSMDGNVWGVKQLLSDLRVDLTADKNKAIRDAHDEEHFEIVRILLENKRFEVGADEGEVVRITLDHASPDTLRDLLANKRVAFTNDELLKIVDIDLLSSSSRVGAFFAAVGPRIWPRVIGNDVVCISRKNGHLRNKLDGLEMKSSWMLLLCVKHICTPVVAARVGDVLREVCSEWTRYQSKEVEVLNIWDYFR